MTNDNPRAALPLCPWCDDDKVRSDGVTARCLGCNWKGELAYLQQVDLRRRPGSNLVSFLETRQISQIDFAAMVWPPPPESRRWQARLAALNNLRKYTDVNPGRPADKILWPRPEMLLRWATLLDVEVSSFFRPRRPRPK